MWLRSQLRRHYFGQIKLVRNNITADFCGCLREKNTHLERLDDHDYRQMRYTVEGNLFIKLYFNWPCYITQEVQYGFLVRWNRELTLKCKLKCYVKLMKDPLDASPSKGNQGTTRGKEKILLNSVGIEPTTSGLDLPLLCRLSYEVGQRKSGTIRWWIAAKRK